MIPQKNKEIVPKATPIKEDDVDDLKQFVQKKQNQNAVLKKLIDKLNADENYTIDK